VPTGQRGLLFVNAAGTQDSDVADWSGVYVGVQAGGLSGDATQNVILGNGNYELSPQGGFVGATTEVLFQSNNLVFGLGGNINWVSATDSTAPFNPRNRFYTDIDWSASVDAKFGVAHRDLLFYGFAGLAGSRITARQVNTIIPGGRTLSETQNVTGWTIGAGVDINLSDNIVAGTEYRYYDFGSQTYFEGSLSERTQKTNLHTISAHIKWRFN
jgi:outer membrane immunogenic protein